MPSTSEPLSQSAPFHLSTPSLMKINVEMMEVYQSSRSEKEFHCHRSPKGGIADLRMSFLFYSALIG